MGRSYSYSPRPQTPGTYHYAVLARKFVKVGRISPALINRITLLVSVVEGAGVVVIDVVAVKDIGNEFQDRGLPDTSLSNEKDSV